MEKYKVTYNIQIQEVNESGYTPWDAPKGEAELVVEVPRPTITWLTFYKEMFESLLHEAQKDLLDRKQEKENEDNGD